MNRQLARAMLRKIGYLADAVEDGAELLDRMRSATYDVILMDMQMPGVDGLEATWRIRRDWPPDQQATAHHRHDRRFCLPEDRAPLPEAGMDDYLSSP